MELPDYLAISYLNQLEYCERRFWYMCVEGEMEENAHVLAGALQHERAHKAGHESAADRTTQRRVYIFSERLRLAGFTDLLEERAGVLMPIEYKHGRLGNWLNDHVQLCAQALCLEERTGRHIEAGEIFYFGGRRRLRVELTPELRARTEAAVARAFEVLEAGVRPPPTSVRARCRDCSLQPICLPDEMKILQAMQQRGNA